MAEGHVCGQVMVPRFQVKFCEKRSTVEILQSCTPIFKFYCLLVDMIAYISQIEDQRHLPPG